MHLLSEIVANYSEVADRPERFGCFTDISYSIWICCVDGHYGSMYCCKIFTDLRDSEPFFDLADTLAEATELSQ